MARIRLFHWKAKEANTLTGPLRAAGHQVDYDEKITPGLISKIRAAPPDAFVIALTCLPSHGREVAVLLRGSKTTRQIPIVFAGGEPEKVDAIRRLIPDAGYTSLGRLEASLRKALARPPADPIVPRQMMDRYGARTSAQKLGILKGTMVGLLDPPQDYASVLGPLPESVSFAEGAGGECAVTLWFVTDAGMYQSGLRRARTLASRTRLWILWPKGGRTVISQNNLRETAKSVGLVDYKICSVSDRWSAMAFARKKA